MKIPTLANLLIPSYFLAISQIVVCFEIYWESVDDVKLNNTYVTEQLYDVSRVKCVGSCALDAPCQTASWNQNLLQCVLSDKDIVDVDWNGEEYLEIASGWLTFARSRCTEKIRAGGKPMADLLYIGVTVRKGNDWKWGDEGGSGFGEIATIYDDDWVKVYWDNGDWDYYRMGAENAFDLMIVERWFDFTRCGNDT